MKKQTSTEAIIYKANRGLDKITEEMKKFNRGLISTGKVKILIKSENKKIDKDITNLFEANKEAQSKMFKATAEEKSLLEREIKNNDETISKLQAIKAMLALRNIDNKDDLSDAELRAVDRAFYASLGFLAGTLLALNVLTKSKTDDEETEDDSIEVEFDEDEE